jgi:anti-sigma factor RsiW
MNCSHCQSLLLDHLYGLLDGADAAALDAHLAACPACAEVRAETARVQGLFARAAKAARAAAPFEPPVPAPKRPRRPPNRRARCARSATPPRSRGPLPPRC